MFTNCKSIEEAKKIYRDLLKKNHPDHGGSHEKTIEIINDFDFFVKSFVKDRIFIFQEKMKKEKGYTPNIDDLPFSDILKKIINFNITIEVIGFWIYCFDAYEIKDQLKEFGFWFSKKHKAWVFSGQKKKSIRTRMTTDDVRNSWGSVDIKEKSEQLQIAV